MTSVMGSFEFDLRDVILEDTPVVLDVTVLLVSGEIRVLSDRVVASNAVIVFASFDDKRNINTRAENDSPHLLINGIVLLLGGLVLKDQTRGRK